MQASFSYKNVREEVAALTQQSCFTGGYFYPAEVRPYLLCRKADDNMGSAFPDRHVKRSMNEFGFKAVYVATCAEHTMQTVSSVTEAAEFLLYQWPAPESWKSKLARQACLDSLERKISPRLVRLAFIEAALEAGIYCEAQIPTNR